MNSSCCCQRKPRTDHGAPHQKTWLHRVRGAAGWVVPGAVLALMPKCPICLAAYVALGTGFTMSGSSAHILMRGLTMLCLGTLALCLVRRVVIFWQNKKITKLQPATHR